MTLIPPHVSRPELFKLSVDQYHEIIAKGILADDDAVELIEGLLYTQMPKNPPHVLAAELVADKLVQAIPRGWHVKRQDPITTSDSEPEPDVCVVRGDKRDYASRHPGPKDLALVVEIADSTLERDRVIKRRAYAKAGIPTYWIVNLVDRVVEVYENLTASSDPTTVTETGTLTLQIDGNPAASIAVRDILP